MENMRTHTQGQSKVKIQTVRLTTSWRNAGIAKEGECADRCSITHFVRTKKGREGIKPSLPRNKKTVQPGGWLNGVDDKDGLRANRIEGTLLRALNPGVMEGIDRATEEVTLAFHHPTRRAKSPMHIRSESYQFLGAGSGFTCPLMRSLSSQRQKTS